MQNKGQFGKNASDLPFVGLSFNPVFPNHGNPPLHHHLDSTKQTGKLHHTVIMF